MSNHIKFDWAEYYFPEDWDLCDMLVWLNERLMFAKQMQIEKEEEPCPTGNS